MVPFIKFVITGDGSLPSDTATKKTQNTKNSTTKTTEKAKTYTKSIKTSLPYTHTHEGIVFQYFPLLTQFFLHRMNVIDEWRKSSLQIKFFNALYLPGV